MRDTKDIQPLADFDWSSIGKKADNYSEQEKSNYQTLTKAHLAN